MPRTVDVPVELRRLGEAFLDRLDEILADHLRATRQRADHYDAVAIHALQDPAATIWRAAIQAMCLDQRGPRPDDLAQYARLAEIRAAQGVPREAFVVATARATDNVWPVVQRIAEQLGVSTEVLLELRVRSERWHTEVMRFVLEAPSQDAAQHRARFLTDLVSGRATPGQISTWAVWFGGAPSRIVVTRGLPPWMRCLLDATPSPEHGLWAQAHGSVVGLVVHAPTPPTGALLAVGPPGPLRNARRSYEVAQRVLNAAERVGRTGALTLDDLGLLPAVLEDVALTEHLLERYVAPVEGIGPGGAALLDTVRAYLAARLRTEDAAQVLFVHPNTVRYRLRRFEELTGADLDDMDVVSQVWWALLARQVRSPSR